jgi:hypothetical protein
MHAGYLGSLGVDVTSAQWDPDPLIPRAASAEDLADLADIFLNPHGYPSPVGADVLGMRPGSDALGRNPRLLDHARLVDAGVRVAGTRATRGTRTSR